MSEDEAWEYLNGVNLAELRRPAAGDARCDEAVATLCQVNRSYFRTRLNANGRSRNGPDILALYAARLLSQGAKTHDANLIDEAMMCLDVANLAVNDPGEAEGPLDRFLVMVGTAQGEVDLVGAAMRCGVSEDLLQLIRTRIRRMSR